MRRRLLLRIAAALVALVLLGAVAVAALAVAVSRGFQRERLRAGLEAALADALGAPVRVAALEGPLYPALSLRGLVVGPAAEPQLAVAGADLRADWLGLLWRGRLEISALELRGLEYQLTRGEDGGWSGLGLAAAGDSAPAAREGAAASERGGGLPFPIAVERAALSEGALRLRWRDAGGARQLDAAVEGELEALALPLSARALRAAGAGLRLRAGPAALGPEAQLESARFDVAVAGGEAVLEAGAARGSFGALELSGRAPLAGWLERGEPASARLELRFRDLDPRPLAGVPGRLTGRADLDASLAAGAPPDALSLRVELEAADSELGGRALQRLALRGQLSGRAWQLEEGAVTGQGIEVEARGRGQAGTIAELRVDARIQEIQAFLPPPDGAAGSELRGSAELHARLEGEWARPLGEIALDARALHVRGVRLGELRLAAHSSEPGVVRIDALALRGGALPLVSRGAPVLRLYGDRVGIEGLQLASGDQRLALDGELSADRAHELRIDARGLDVAALAGLAEAPVALAGRLDLDLVLDGPLARPALRGRADWAQPRVGELRLDSAAGSVSSEAGELRFEATLRAEGAELLAARGALPADRLADGDALLGSPALRLDLRGDDVDLALFAALLPEAVPHLGGRARLALELRGGPTPGAQGEIAWRGGSAEVVGLGRLEPLTGSLRVSPHARGIAIDSLELRAGRQRLEARGVLGADAFHDLELRVEDLEAALLAPLLDATGELEGRLQVQARLDGPFAQPSLRGEVSGSALRLGKARLQSLAAQVETRGGVLEATLAARALEREILTGTLRAPYPAILRKPASALETRGFAAELRSTGFELAALQPFLPRELRDLGGRLDADLTVRGGTPAPALTGTASWSEGRIAVPILRHTYQPIAGRLSLDGDALQVEELTVGPPEARARLRGTVGLEDLRPGALDLALAAEHFPLSRNPLLEMDGSGTIRLTGRAEAPRLEGELSLERAEVSLRGADDPALREITVVAGGESGPASLEEQGGSGPDPFAASAIAFRLVVPRNTWVRGEGADFEIQGDLELRKRPFEEAALVGSTRVVRGSYEFQGKRFDVRQGSATFDGATAVDPVLDVEAAYRVADVNVLLFVTGRASSPTLRLASEPPMPESDVVAYLFLGRPADQVSGGQSRGVEAVAAGFAAGIAADQARALLGDALPVDMLDVRMAESGMPAEIAVGKYVSERLFVRYGRTIGPDPVDEVSVELELTDQLSVESDVSSDSNAGLDLIWSLDY